MLFKYLPDIVFLSETWLHSSDSPSFSGYSIIRLDRQDLNRGGGVLFLLRSGLTSTSYSLNKYRNGIMEVIGCRVFVDGAWICILGIYNPVGQISEVELDYYFNQVNGNLLIIGDFNAKHNSWSRGSANGAGRSLFNFILQSPTICLLTPPYLPTHYCQGSGIHTTIDLCLGSNIFLPITSTQVLPDSGSDHLPIMVAISMSPSYSASKSTPRWIIKDKSSLRKFQNDIVLNVDGLQSCDDLVTNLQTTFNLTASDHFRKSRGISKSNFSKPWWSPECSKAVAQRRRAKHLLSRSPNDENLFAYKRCTAVARHTIKSAKRLSWHTYCGTINSMTSTSQVWQRFNSVRGQQKQRTFPIIVNNAPLLTSDEKASHLGLYFDGLFNIPIRPLPCIFELDVIKNAIHGPIVHTGIDGELTSQELSNVLASLPMKKAPGWDAIPYEFMTSPPEKLFKYILKTFNECWAQGTFPNSLKKAVILPILKPNKDPSLSTSYRPISLLPTIGKVFEKVIYNRLYSFVERKNLINRFQSGFRRKHSVLDQHLRLEHVIREALVSQNVVFVVYLDLKAAFDSVLHHKLLFKMASIGIGGRLLRMIQSFLTSRTFQTYVNGSYSKTYKTATGVPQGSILSPLLFLIILSSIPGFDLVKATMYADDIALFICAPNMTLAKQQMQNALNILSVWAADWGFHINPQKCSFQYYTRKRKFTVPTLAFNNVPIPTVKVQKFLGLLLDSPLLKWDAHIDYLKKECFKRLNILKALTSTSWGCSRKTLLLFYVSFVRSKLDFGCQVYGSASKTTLDKLEIFQNSAIRTIIGALKSTPIVSLRCELAIPSIYQRRKFLIISTYLKLLRLPDTHPLVDEVFQTLSHSLNLAWRDVHQATFIVRAHVAIQHCFGHLYSLPRYPLPLVSPVSPWKEPISVYLDLILPVSKSNSSQLLCQTFMSTLEVRFSNYIQIYTDGSRIVDGEDISSVSAAIYVPSISCNDSWLLPSDFSVLSAELFGILMALTYIEGGVPGNFVICVDSLSALHGVKNSSPKNFTELIYPILILISSLQDNGFQIALQWTPGHCGIISNEKVDGYAKSAHSLQNVTIFPTPYADQLSFLKRQLQKDEISEWNLICDETHLGLIKDKWVKLPWGALPNRRAEVVFARLRLGHSRLKGHLFKLGLIESPLCMICGVTETVSHVIMNCPCHRDMRKTLKLSLKELGVTEFTLKNLLGGGNFKAAIQYSILRCLYTFLVETRLLDSI
ncbi:unnamed protein product [Rotaria socialis]|uniref:RNA-directed DNA polymerase from mobile element jockey n=1 Tax=Rotaria socialis TaxID=392032 RepID=A0A818C6C9_9BILA|nr:unnamed protein product [Rotaria socialis]CAF4769988.1 unnamed protein product [Rotaria socialis]